MKRINILFVGKRFNTNRDALLEKFGRNYQFPRHLSARHDVSLWLVDYHDKSIVRSTDGQLSIISTPVKSLAFFHHYMLVKCKTIKPIELVIASGDCYIGLIAHRIAKKMKARFVFDVYDKYDEFSGYIKPLGFDLFGYLLKIADIRLFASRALFQSLGHSQLDAVLANGVDANHFRPIDKAEARIKLGLPVGQKFIGYFGSMEADRGVEDLVAAVGILRKQGENVELLLGGKIDPGLDLNQPPIRYLGNVPFKNIPYALAASDVLTVPYRRSPFMDAGASNKIAEAIACQRPIVGTRSPNLMANFPDQAEELAPYLAEPGNPVSLAEALARQLADMRTVSTPAGIYWDEITSAVEKHIERLWHDFA